MRETILKIQHAAASRKSDRSGMVETEKELESLGVYCRWLSDDILIWEDEKTFKRRQKNAPVVATDTISVEFYEGIVCRSCGAPVEKTGRQGRPPTLCLKHRS